MDWDLVAKFGWMIALILQGLIAWIGWSLQKRFVLRDDYERDLKSLETVFTRDIGEIRNLADHTASKMDQMESRFNGVPSHSEIHELSLAIERLSGRLGGLVQKVEADSENQKRFERVLDRVETFLLTNNGSNKR